MSTYLVPFGAMISVLKVAVSILFSIGLLLQPFQNLVEKFFVPDVRLEVSEFPNLPDKSF
jgi:hypothetical protein